MKSQQGSPTGSIRSQYSGTSRISSVSSTSRRQYEDRIKRLEEALVEKNQQLISEKFENTRHHSEIRDQKNQATNQDRREQELIDERNSQRQQIADLRTCLDEQDKKWIERSQWYEQQIAAMEEHQKQQAKTHRMEIEQLMMRAEETSQRGKYIPEGYTQHIQVGKGQPLRQRTTAPLGHHLNVKGEPQWPMDLKDEPQKEVQRKVAKQQEADCRKQGLEQKRTFQNQVAHRTMAKAPSEPEPEALKDTRHGSPEDSEGGMETPSQDSEEESEEESEDESEDTHDRLQRKIQEKAPGNRYKQDGGKGNKDIDQQEPKTTKEIIMARYLSDRDDEQSLPYGPDHWSTDVETPPQRECGEQQDTHDSSQKQNGHVHHHNHHCHHNGSELKQADTQKKGQDRQFRLEWQDPPKPTRVTTAPRYNHQRWKNIPPQDDRQSTVGSSHSRESWHGGHNHSHRHQRDNHWNHGHHQGHQRGHHRGHRFQGYHDYRQHDHSDDGSNQG